MSDPWQRLIFEYSVWTTHAEGQRLPLPDPVALGRQDHRRIVHTAEAFHRLLEKTIRMCAAQPQALDYFQLSPDLLAMFRAARADEPIVARFDFFLCEDGLKVSEFNTDCCAGINETQGLYDIFLQRSDLFDATRRLLELILRRQPKCIGLMYPTGYSDDLEQIHFLRTSLERLGVRTVVGSPANFEFNGRRLSAFGETIDVLYRYFLTDWMQGLRTLPALLEAYRRSAFDMITGFGQIVCQTKKVMAFWYDHLEHFSREEQRLIREHVPRTRRFADVGRDEALANRHRLVVKRGFGNMGNEVILGPLLDEQEFAECLDWVQQEPDEWVVQDFFRVRPLEDGMYPCFGAYMIDGAFAGYYTRLAPEPYICYTARVAPTIFEKLA